MIWKMAGLLLACSVAGACYCVPAVPCASAPRMTRVPCYALGTRAPGAGSSAFALALEQLEYGYPQTAVELLEGALESLYRQEPLVLRDVASAEQFLGRALMEVGDENRAQSCFLVGALHWELAALDNVGANAPDAQGMPKPKSRTVEVPTPPK